MKTTISVWVTLGVLAIGTVANYAVSQDHIKINAKSIEKLEIKNDKIAIIETRQEAIQEDIREIKQDLKEAIRLMRR